VEDLMTAKKQALFETIFQIDYKDRDNLDMARQEKLASNLARKHHSGPG